MKIGINGQFLNEPDPTGIHVLGRGIVNGLSQIDTENEYIIYTDQKQNQQNLKLGKNFTLCFIKPCSIFSSPWWLHVQLPLQVMKDKVDLMLFCDHRTFLLWKPCKTVAIMLDLGFIFYPSSFKRLRRWKFKALTYGAVNRADHLLAISRSTQKDIIRYYHKSRACIDVITMGYDKNAARTVRNKEEVEIMSRLGIEPGYFLHIGVFQPRKNIEGMLKAFRIFKEKEKGNTQLILAGKKGWLFDSIINLIENDNICKRHVRWLGYVDDETKWALYKNARSLVFPSFYEGFGIPALESMACGTPVLYANCSSLPEVVGDAGIGFNPHQVDEIAAAMDRIIHNDRLYDSLKKKGIQRVESFTWDKTAARIMEVFNKIKN